MRYALIDLEGSTLETFGGRPRAWRYIQRLLREDPDLGRELALVPYDGGERAGPAIPADEFLSQVVPVESRIELLATEDSPRISVSLEARSSEGSRALISVRSFEPSAEVLTSAIGAASLGRRNRARATKARPLGSVSRPVAAIEAIPARRRRRVRRSLAHR
jgi:hypothetical protein